MSSKYCYRVVCCFLLLMLAMQFGCSRFLKIKRPHYRTVTGELGVNTETARQRNADAITCLEVGNLARAQQLANESLVADPSFGPAHNTLGKIYFQHKKYYLAAWEFEYANQAMPERIEPLNNLGLVYERVGRYDQAVAFYESAFAQSPDTPEILGNLIRAKLARGDTPFSIQDQINHLILIDDRPQWVNWAKLKLLSDGTEQKLLLESQQDLDSTGSDMDSPASEEFLPFEVEENGIGESVEEIQNGAIENELGPALNFSDGTISPPIDELPSPASVLDGSSSR